MHRIGQWLLVIALILGVTLLAAEPTQAQSTSGVTSTTGATGTDSSGCKGYVGLTNKVASCVRATIDKVSYKFFTQFYNMLARAVGLFLTLYIIFFGVMAASGGLERVSRDTMLMLVKLTLVGFFTQNTPLIYENITAGMDALGRTVVQVTPRSGMADGTSDFSDSLCLKNLTEASIDNKKPVSGPWLAMDCLVDTVIGIKIPTEASGGGSSSVEKYYNEKIKGRGLQRGMVFFFFSGMQTSVVGIILAVIGFVFIYGLIAMILKCLMTYILSFIAVTFMVIISPLFIPLAMFRGDLRQYFDKWVKLTISFALQPVLMLLFISLAVTAVDLALVSGEYSLMYRVAGKASQASDFSLNEYFEKHDIIKDKELPLAYAKTDTKPLETTTNKGAAIISNITETTKCVISGEKSGKGTEDEACKGNVPIQIFRNSIDWKKLAEVRDPKPVLEDGATRPEQQITREIIAAAIFLGVVVFIMNRLMSVVPHILVDLVGDLGQSPNVFREATREWNTTANAASAGMTNTVNQFASMVTKRASGAR